LPTIKKSLHKMAASLAIEPIAKLLTGKRWLVCVNKDDTIATVLSVLNEYNISSVPVFDSRTKRLVALASAMDIMSFLAFETYFKRFKKEQIQFHIHLADLTKPVIELVSAPRSEFHGTSMNVTIEEQSNLRQAMEIFSQGIYRVMVGDGTPEKTKILSQVDVIRFLIEKYDLLPTSTNRPLKELGVVTNRLVNKVPILTKSRT